MRKLMNWKKWIILSSSVIILVVLLFIGFSIHKRAVITNIAKEAAANGNPGVKAEDFNIAIVERDKHEDWIVAVGRRDYTGIIFVTIDKDTERVLSVQVLK